MSTTKDISISEQDGLHSPEDQKKKPSWHIQVNFPAVDFGGKVSMENQTLIISLLGTYVAPDLTDFSKLVTKIDKFVLDLENNLNFSIPNIIKPTLMTYASFSAVFAVESFPQYPVGGPAIEAITCLSVALVWFDDVVELSLANLPNSQKWRVVDNAYSLLRNVMTGVYPTAKDIPNTVPELEGSFCCFHKAQELARSIVPQYCEIVEPYLLAMADYFKASFLMGTSDTEVSLNTYRFNRIDDIAFAEWLEFGLLLESFHPKPEVRNHYLYRFILRLMSWTLNLVNDVFSLTKDIRRDQTGNYVRLLVKEEGLSLADALKKTNKEINILTKEIESLFEQLVDVFEDDLDVKRLTETMRNAHNGCITSYKYVERYGHNSCKVIEKLT